jgi:hypothetical protein
MFSYILVIYMGEPKQVLHLCMQQHCIITTEANCSSEKCSDFELCDPFYTKKRYGALPAWLEEKFKRESRVQGHKPKTLDDYVG